MATFGAAELSMSRDDLEPLADFLTYEQSLRTAPARGEFEISLVGTCLASSS